MNHINHHQHWRPQNNDSPVLDHKGLSGALARTPLLGTLGPDTLILACEIVDGIQLSKANDSYCALSYCAGSPTKSETILVNGVPFNAFVNLAHAMEEVMKCWTALHPDKELLLRVDQISINQKDENERRSQVKMMKDIYRRANETFICLSNPDLDKSLSWFHPCVKLVKSGQPLTALEDYEVFALIESIQ